MSSPAKLVRARRILVLVLTFGLLLLSSVASAAGRVEWKAKEFKEREGGSWRLELAIFMPSAPDVAHVPMRFEFQPIAYYERSMVDGDKLLERVVPLEHRQSLIESVDVGFLDSGSGKIEKRTRFTFKVTRAHGYEAGEYKVTIRDGRNSNTIGTPTTLKFTGENEIIDRRAMVFTGKEKKKKKEDAGSGDAPASGDDSGDAASTKTDSPASDSEPSEETSDSQAGDEEEGFNDSDGPTSIEEKPGGCGCRIPAVGSTGSGSLAFALLFGLLVLARRRASS